MKGQKTQVIPLDEVDIKIYSLLSCKVASFEYDLWSDGPIWGAHLIAGHQGLPWGVSMESSTTADGAPGGNGETGGSLLS